MAEHRFQVRLRVLVLGLYSLVFGIAILPRPVSVEGAIALLLLLELGFQRWGQHWLQDALTLTETASTGHCDGQPTESLNLQELGQMNEVINPVLLAVSAQQKLSTSVAIAIRQANRYDQMQRLNLELAQQVQAHTAQFQEALDFESLLKRITDRVRDSLDESQILQCVVQELAQGLEVGSCLTAIYDLNTQEVIPQYEYTTFFSSVSHRSMPLEQLHPPHQQLLNKHSLHYCECHPVWGRISLLVCPILDDQGVLGELRLATYANRTFDELQIRVAQQVANQCAIAIRQARLYQSAQRQVQELERLNQLKDDFLSTVSHELRTPMATIRMALQMIDVLLRKAEIPEATSLLLQQYLGVLEIEGDREMGLINDLLELSCLDARTEPILPTCIELRTWLPHIAEVFTVRLEAQNQTLTVQVADSVGTVALDLAHLEHILMELLNNACKYTPPGEGIVIAAHADTSTLYISVMNSGVEIQADEFEHIFEKFYRIPNGDPWKYGGKGLGLALVKKRVTHLGGSIKVASTQGRTIFTVHLPLNSAACRQASLHISKNHQ